jgi:hypothetical protein
MWGMLMSSALSARTSVEELQKKKVKSISRIELHTLSPDDGYGRISNNTQDAALH